CSRMKYHLIQVRYHTNAGECSQHFLKIAYEIFLRVANTLWNKLNYIQLMSKTFVANVDEVRRAPSDEINSPSHPCGLREISDMGLRYLLKCTVSRFALRIGKFTFKIIYLNVISNQFNCNGSYIHSINMGQLILRSLNFIVRTYFNGQFKRLSIESLQSNPTSQAQIPLLETGKYDETVSKMRN
ncbi:hypothetical protein L9F63_024508, partial [Diploptera punctata]